MKFPIKLVFKLNHLFPQLNPLYKQCPVGMQKSFSFTRYLYKKAIVVISALSKKESQSHCKTFPEQQKYQGKSI